MQTWALNKYTIILLPIVYSLSPVYQNFHSYDILPEFREYSDLRQSAYPGIKWRWAQRCYAYYVTQLWRHHRVLWLNCLRLTTTGRVAHDAIRNQIRASDVIPNVRILIHFGLHWYNHAPTINTRHLTIYVCYCKWQNVYPKNVFLHFDLSRSIYECNVPRPRFRGLAPVYS